MTLVMAGRDYICPYVLQSEKKTKMDNTDARHLRGVSRPTSMPGEITKQPVRQDDDKATI